MRKNKKATIISLEVLIGVVVSIIIIVSAVTIISNFYRLSDSSKDSFNQLVALIEEVNQNNHGTIKSMPLRMDKDTVIIGFTKNDEDFHFRDEQIGSSQEGDTTVNSLFKKPVGKGCETNKSCICLCRKLKIGSAGEGGYVECEDKSLICKVLDEIEFPNYLPQESKVYFRKNGFVISSSYLFPTEDYSSQFKEVSVQKYEEFDTKAVAVCENPSKENKLYDNCVPLNYKEEKKAIYGLTKLKDFIESCKDKEFVNAEEPEPCSCGAFDFRSEIPEKYIVEFTESDEKNLKLILRHDNKEEIITSIEVDMPLCIFHPILEGTDYVDQGQSIIEYTPFYKYYLTKEESIVFKHNLPISYTFYYEGNVKDERIVFIKKSNENICILKYSERGHIGLNENSLDTITFKYNLKPGRQGTTTGHLEINITGCEYSITEG